ncbi:hypothetical protein CEXT_205001 [Caerostris extrusa]|uniref:Uncharacterized protein n=1 Tax=Caerostris extrusa TaxID=172846 RepID=A0AAV4XJF1_CAEEX|nr:hypothetical protein CEXT_205001 [Caerostris extrusa]
MISEGESVSELDNSREDHSSVLFLGGGGSRGRGRRFVELSIRKLPPKRQEYVTFFTGGCTWNSFCIRPVQSSVESE